MKKTLLRWLLVAMFTIGATTAVMAQNSLPAPGSGGSFTPSGGGGNPGGPGGPGGPGPAIAGPGPGWGSPWYGPAYFSPVIYTNYTSGTTSVVGCGYDAMGVWRVIPMKVAYNYNGVQYSAEVLNAWNPWTDMWDYGVDVNAVYTSYYLRGTTYNFYVVLSTGTFYFNL